MSGPHRPPGSMADSGVPTPKWSLMLRDTPTYSKILTALVDITYTHLECTNPEYIAKDTFARFNDLAARNKSPKSETEARTGLEDFTATLSHDDMRELVRTAVYRTANEFLRSQKVGLMFLREMMKSTPRPSLDSVIHQILEAHFAEVKTQLVKDQAEQAKNLAHSGPGENETGSDGGAGFSRGPLTKPAEQKQPESPMCDTRETEMNADEVEARKMLDKLRKKIQARKDAASNGLPQAPPTMPTEPMRRPFISMEELKAHGELCTMMREAIKHAALKKLPRGSSTELEPTDKMQALSSSDVEKTIADLKQKFLQLAFAIRREKDDASRLFDLLRKEYEVTTMLNDARQHATPQSLPQGSSTKSAEPEKPEKTQAPSFNMKKMDMALHQAVSKGRAQGSSDKAAGSEKLQVIIYNLDTEACIVRALIAHEKDANKLRKLHVRLEEVMDIKKIIQERVSDGLLQGSFDTPAGLKLLEMMAGTDEDAGRLRELFVKKEKAASMLKDAIKESRKYAFDHPQASSVAEKLGALDADVNRLRRAIIHQKRAMQKKTEAGQHATITANDVQGFSLPQAVPTKPAESEKTTGADEDESRLRDLVIKKEEVTSMIKQVRQHDVPFTAKKDKLSNLACDAHKLNLMISSHEEAMRKKEEARQHEAPKLSVEARRGVYTKDSPAATVNVVTPQEDESRSDINVNNIERPAPANPNMTAKERAMAAANKLNAKLSKRITVHHGQPIDNKGTDAGLSHVTLPIGSRNDLDKIKDVMRKKLGEAIAMLGEAEEWAKGNGVRETNPASSYMVDAIDSLGGLENVTGVRFTIEDGIGIRSYSQLHEVLSNEASKAVLHKMLKGFKSIFNKEYIKTEAVLEAIRLRCKTLDKITSLLQEKVMAAVLFVNMAETLALKDELPEVDTLVSEAIKELNQLKDATGIHYRFECDSGILDYSYTEESDVDKSIKAELEKMVAHYMILFNEKWTKFRVVLEAANTRSMEAQKKAAQQSESVKGSASQSLDATMKKEVPQSSRLDSLPLRPKSEDASQKPGSSAETSSGDYQRRYDLMVRREKLMEEYLRRKGHAEEEQTNKTQAMAPEPSEDTVPDLVPALKSSGSSKTVPNGSDDDTYAGRFSPIRQSMGVRHDLPTRSKKIAIMAPDGSEVLFHDVEKKATPKLPAVQRPSTESVSGGKINLDNFARFEAMEAERRARRCEKYVAEHDAEHKARTLKGLKSDAERLRMMCSADSLALLDAITRDARTKDASQERVLPNPSLIESTDNLHSEKLLINIEPIDGFHLRARIVGPDGEYIKFIQRETGCKVELKGRGSGWIHSSTGQEGEEPLWLHIRGPEAEGVAKAMDLCENLIERVSSDFHEFKEKLERRANDEKKQQQIHLEAMKDANAAALQQMQLALLDQQNKKKLLRARQEQGTAGPTDKAPTSATAAAVPAKPTPAEPSGPKIRWPAETKDYLSEAAASSLRSGNPGQRVEASEIRRMMDENLSMKEMCEQLEAKGLNLHRYSFGMLLLMAPKIRRSVTLEDKKRLDREDEVAEEQASKRAKVDVFTAEVGQAAMRAVAADQADKRAKVDVFTAKINQAAAAVDQEKLAATSGVDNAAEDKVSNEAKADESTPEAVSDKDWDIVSDQGSEDFVMVGTDE